MTDRAISTAMDVALAILLISASVAMIAYATQTDDGTVSAEKAADADYTAQTFTALTVHTSYSLEPVVDDEGDDLCPDTCDNFFDESAVSEDGRDSYIRAVHGSAPALVADAAVSNATMPVPARDGRQANVTKEGVAYEEALSGSIQGRITGAHNRTQIVAIWRPYDRADISGTVTLGATPPADADISTARVQTASQIPPVEDAAVERRYRTDGYRGVGRLVARAIVRGYFPPEDTQLALESDGLRRQRVVYRYKRMGTIVGTDWNLDGGVASYVGNSPLKRGSADAPTANKRLVRADGPYGDTSATIADQDTGPGLAAIVARDMRQSYDDPSATEIADRVHTGEVTIIVRTW